MNLTPGSKVDLRGRSLDAETWAAIRAAATGPDGRVRLGRCWFDDVSVEGVSFHGVVFEGDVSFGRAEFAKSASFYQTVFKGNASFRSTVFTGNASFHEAVFHGHADFSRARFGGDALFGHAVWHRDAWFTEALFQSAADFDRAAFGRDAVFRGACFRSVVSLRNTRVAGSLLLGRVWFQDNAWVGPVTAGGRVGLDSARALRCLRVSARAPAVTARRAVARQAHLKTPADLSQAVVEELLLEGTDPDACVLDDARIGALTVRRAVPADGEPYRTPLRRAYGLYAVGALALLAIVLITFLSVRQVGQAPAHLAHLGR